MLISDIINKRTYNISGALDLGLISAVTYIDGYIGHLLTDKGYALRTCDIMAISDAVTCTSHCLTNELLHKAFPHTDVDILTTDGKAVGRLRDIAINREYKVTRLICDQKNARQFNIKSYSECAIILDHKTASAKKPTEDMSIPTVVTNYEFLIGRTVYKNILSSDNRAVFESGHIITASDIPIARKMGKLVQLTLYSTPITR